MYESTNRVLIRNINFQHMTNHGEKGEKTDLRSVREGEEVKGSTGNLFHIKTEIEKKINKSQ